MEIIFGIRAIIEAIKAGKDIEKLFLKKGLQGDLFRELIDIVRENNIAYQFVPLAKIDGITRKNHQGAVAYISAITYYNIEQIVPTLFEKGKIPFILVLDQITDVRNFGAIVRTAECSGVDAIVVPNKGSALLSSDAVKTSAGALLKMPICRSNSLKDTLIYLKNCGIQLIAATEKTEKYYYNIDFRSPSAIVMGAEDTGINVDYLKMADGCVKIPMAGSIGSLNVSVAAGIFMYEVVRQRYNSI